MIGNFDDVPPTPIQIRTMGRLLGWRLGMDNVDPKGTVELESAGSHFTTFPAGSMAKLPTIFTHRDVSNTDCPGNAAYALMDEIRDIASHVNDPPEELLKALQGGVIYEHWQAIGGMNSVLGAPTSTEASGGALPVTSRSPRSNVLVARNRCQAGHRRDLRRLGLTELRTWSTRLADQRGNTTAASDHPELPAWNVEL